MPTWIVALAEKTDELTGEFQVVPVKIMKIRAVDLLDFNRKLEALKVEFSEKYLPKNVVIVSHILASLAIDV